ncbi:hypothetical protein [Flavobacterium sp. NKUCC04_CG]|uniref:hypothetical protein n=1 Tax=Flavobacterium sp. NKUCC04_CG TaxID=2842121 RepID=UPI001C5B69B1|nr:hypothetical protein [Flavobacterium sp. NKUCC04_CG]MBW3519516.1 hypothetical protein [Flavobacterium sp. NKUCC04_CG]
MSVTLQNIEETIRITETKIQLHFVVIEGREEAFFCIIAPTLMISGYGNTQKEATESFQHNVDVFIDDIATFTDQEREAFFTNLGFKKDTLLNFSKAYRDETKVLQGFTSTTVKTAEVEIIS